MAYGVNIGELDTMVTLCETAQTIGSQGAKQWTVTNSRKVFAKVDNSVTESVGDRNLEANSSISLTIYKFPELTTRWRVLIGTCAYEIVSIDPIERLSPYCILTLNSIDY